MTLFWIAAAVMIAGVLGFLLPPLLRHRAPESGGTGQDIAVYREQLREVGRDLESGHLSGDQAAAARTEIERRILAAADASDKQGARARPEGARFVNRVLMGTIVLVVSVGTMGLYLVLGSPGVPDQPLAQRADVHAAAQRMTEMGSLVEQLASRLEDNPDNLDGWLLLARSFISMGRFEDAVESYRRAVGLSGRDPSVITGFAEAMVMAAEGTVTDEALALFEEITDGDPADPRAGFYIGLARRQHGDGAGALEAWADLEANAPGDAPWLTGLRQRIEELAGELGVEAPAMGAAPETPEAPGISEDDRQDMIRTMVEGLAGRLKENPDDLEGWLRLGRSYEVLGETEKAREAMARAEALKKGAE